MEMICIHQGPWIGKFWKTQEVVKAEDFGPKYLEFVEVKDSPFNEDSFVISGYEYYEVHILTDFKKKWFVPPADISELKEILQSELKETD